MKVQEAHTRRTAASVRGARFQQQQKQRLRYWNGDGMAGVGRSRKPSVEAALQAHDILVTLLHKATPTRLEAAIQQYVPIPEEDRMRTRAR